MWIYYNQSTLRDALRGPDSRGNPRAPSSNFLSRPALCPVPLSVPLAWLRCTLGPIGHWVGIAVYDELSANGRIEGSVEELEDRPNTLDLDIEYPMEEKLATFAIIN